MKIYISGSITNNPNYMDEFINKEIELTEQGHEVINPAKTNSTLPKSTTYNQYMSMCYVMLDMADAIYMLHGWEKSKGACIEYGYALAMDKIIVEE